MNLQHLLTTSIESELRSRHVSEEGIQKIMHPTLPKTVPLRTLYNLQYFTDEDCKKYNLSDNDCEQLKTIGENARIQWRDTMMTLWKHNVTKNRAYPLPLLDPTILHSDPLVKKREMIALVNDYSTLYNLFFEYPTTVLVNPTQFTQLHDKTILDLEGKTIQELNVPWGAIVHSELQMCVTMKELQPISIYGIIFYYVMLFEYYNLSPTDFITTITTLQESMTNVIIKGTSQDQAYLQLQEEIVRQLTDLLPQDHVRSIYHTFRHFVHVLEADPLFATLVSSYYRLKKIEEMIAEKKISFPGDMTTFTVVISSSQFLLFVYTIMKWFHISTDEIESDPFSLDHTYHSITIPIKQLLFQFAHPFPSPHPDVSCLNVFDNMIRLLYAFMNKDLGEKMSLITLGKKQRLKKSKGKQRHSKKTYKSCKKNTVKK